MFIKVGEYLINSHCVVYIGKQENDPLSILVRLIDQRDMVLTLNSKEERDLFFDSVIVELMKGG